uniref:Mitochondrial carrier protein n=1 Tax=Arcella intermedia TaxID=1963864 RepID=A0A6B2LC54_9EUKA
MQTTNLYENSFRGMIKCFKDGYRESGIRGLYRGAQSPLFGMAGLNATLYLGYGQGRDVILKSTGQKELFLHQQVFAGWFAGFWCTLVEGPVDFFKCQLQMRPKEYRGYWHCLFSITRAYGLKGFFQGFGPSLTRNVPAYGFYFGGYESTKLILSNQFLQKHNYSRSKEVIVTLIAGGFGGLWFWVPTYPVDVVKSAIQSDSPHPKEKKYSSMLDCAKKIYGEYGWRGFYKGFTPCAIRGFGANAFAWSGYEYSMRALNKISYLDIS